MNHFLSNKRKKALLKFDNGTVREQLRPDRRRYDSWRRKNAGLFTLGDEGGRLGRLTGHGGPGHLFGLTGGCGRSVTGTVEHKIHLL